MCKCFHIKVRHPLLLQRLLKKIAISVARRWQTSPREKSLLIKKMILHKDPLKYKYL